MASVTPETRTPTSAADPAPVASSTGDESVTEPSGLAQVSDSGSVPPGDQASGPEPVMAPAVADGECPVPAPRLFVVIPCYNEQDVLPITMPLFRDKLAALEGAGLCAADSRILLVNDGSSDGTWGLIAALADAHEEVVGVSLSRNRGHQNALLCGLSEALAAGCDCTISVDCDGQDDLAAMDEMLAAYRAGHDIVYGVRSDRSSDSWFKRTTAQGFYRFMGAMGVESVYNHADYRLMSARALRALLDLPEVNLFLRGMVPLVGFSSTSVAYARHERMAGRSHYPLSKMIGLAVNGITSLSVKPIRLITTFGFLVAVGSFVGIIWALVSWALGNTISGWTSMMVAMFFLGGVQLMALGVIGEYVGKVYLETKRRPRWVVSARTPGLPDD